MAIYNLTNVTNANSFGESIIAINSVSNGLYAIFVLLISYIIIFMVFKRYDTKAVFLTSSAIMTLGGIVFYFAEMISEGTLLMPTLMFLISVFVYIFSSN